MKLDRVEIKNFRSIKDITVYFDPTCRVLVGINESGKSNILAALALLDKGRNPVKKDDLREALPDEDPIEDSYIRFVFKFEKDESDQLLDKVSSKILSTIKNTTIVSFGGKNKTVKEFCAERSEGLYSADILEESKLFKYWSLESKYKLLSGWKKPTSACPQDYNVKLKLVGQIEKGYELPLMNLINSLQLNSKVIFTGPIYDLKKKIKVIQDSDIFVLPSKREASPQALIEAMALGKIVISSSTYGGREFIVSGKNGFIFSDKEELVKLIEAAIKNPKKMRNIQNEARKSVLNFSWENIARKEEKLYNSKPK
ncbi:glycosyltransferase [Patescibacteria group bacterium]|nr:glycosyltransferase [Patescibacteria group bacterium]